MDNKHDGKIFDKVYRVAPLIFGVISLIMIFLPNAFMVVKETVQDGNDIVKIIPEFSGINVAFGAAKDVFEGVSVSFSASIVILSYLLVLAGVALSVLDLLGYGGKIVPVIDCALFCGAAVLFFLTTNVVNYTIDIVNPDLYVSEFKASYGALTGGALSILASVISFVYIFLPKTKIALRTHE